MEHPGFVIRGKARKAASDRAANFCSSLLAVNQSSISSIV
jgi:hypothetical protein